MKKNKLNYWPGLKELVADKLRLKIFMLLCGLGMFHMQVAFADSQVNDSKRMVAPFVESIQQQKHIVKGKVSDKNGEPVPGATVMVKGTAIGVVTDFDGNYTISTTGDATIVFSFVGMKSMEVVVAERNTVDVVLEVDAVGLEEVVAIGYGTQQKVTLTGAIGTVGADELTQRPVANTSELLQGQIAGVVTRQASGLPGSDGTSISIRGFGSPLVLVDGVRASMSHVDPNDIESISVLKDASAAIYGAEAGNGVILVTTKRGENKQAVINYHGTYSFTNLTYRPNKVNAQQWAELMYESGQSVNDATPDHVTYDHETKQLTNSIDGSVFEGYDWTGSVLRNWVPQQQHNINASGGSEKIKYFISAGFTDQESNFKSGDYDYQRYNIRSNIDAEITDDLGVSLDFVYRQNQLNKANFNINSIFLGLETANPTYPVIHEADPSKATYSGFLERSPYHMAFKENSGFIDNRTNAIQGAFEVRYNFPMVTGLTAKARLAYEDIFFLNKTVSRPFDVWDYNAAAAEGEDPWIYKGTQNSRSSINVANERELELMPSFRLEYNRQFGDHKISGLFMNETRKWKEFRNGGNRKDVLSFEAPYLSYASELGMSNYEYLLEKGRTSFIGRVNYDYQGKYIFQMTMRADASAEYPEEGRWGYFPSMSAGWRLSEESFIKDNFSAVDNLKLRASYGKLGKDEVSSFDYLTGYNISTNTYIFGNTPAPIIASAGLANPDVTWESMQMYNVGLDGTFWNGLLGFEVDGFYRLREDILAYPTEGVPSTFGASLPKTNLNSIDDRGFELLITHRNKIGDFSYDISPMISWKRSKYVSWQEEISEDPEWNARNLREGQWTDRRWGYVSDGFFMNEDDITNHTVDQDRTNDGVFNQGIVVGDIKYKDLNGDNFIDWHDQKVIGKSGTPNFNYSLNLGGEYKRFRLSMLLTGQSHYTLAIGGALAAPFINGSIPVTEHYENRSIIGIDDQGKEYITNPGAKLPPVKQIGITANNSLGSDFWIYNARFVRLKNINLSYTLPQNLASKAGVKSCTFYVAGTNLLTLSNLGIYKNAVDPEVSTSSTEGRNYPPVKTFTFGLKVNL